MERTEFKRLIENICSFWERSVPKSEDVKEIWFEQLRWIPSGYGERLFAKMARLRNRPGNIILEIKSAFRELEDYTKRDAERLVGCDQCHDGHIWARPKGGNMMVFRCGHCKLSNKHELKMAKREDLLLKGYALDYIHRVGDVLEEQYEGQF